MKCFTSFCTIEYPSSIAQPRLETKLLRASVTLTYIYFLNICTLKWRGFQLQFYFFWVAFTILQRRKDNFSGFRHQINDVDLVLKLHTFLVKVIGASFFKDLYPESCKFFIIFFLQLLWIGEKNRNNYATRQVYMLTGTYNSFVKRKVGSKNLNARLKVRLITYLSIYKVWMANFIFMERKFRIFRRNVAECTRVRFLWLPMLLIHLLFFWKKLIAAGKTIWSKWAWIAARSRRSKSFECPSSAENINLSKSLLGICFISFCCT